MNGNRIISYMLAEKEILSKLISRFEREVKYLPEGGLCRKVIKGKPYLYHCTESETGTFVQSYISNEDNELKNALKRKRFIQCSLPYLRNNIKIIDAFLKKYRPYSPSEIIESLPKAYEGLDYCINYYDIGENESSLWSKEDYVRNELYPDGKIHGTINGLKVRSKSEAIIAGLLEVNSIPFRYEAALYLGEKVYYPDFTILRPRDNKILYWEHFGMADDEEYSFSMNKKMTIYRKHGIVPWNQLITTYEVEKGSSDAQDIQSIINAFIL